MQYSASFRSDQKIVVRQNQVSIVSGEFNGDGQPDLAVVDNGSNDSLILLANNIPLTNDTGGLTPATRLE
jgi:hypothetical protein